MVVSYISNLMASTAFAPTAASTARRDGPPPPLENGAYLGAAEFMRRYEAAPEIKKAELIARIVYIMASDVRCSHGVAHASMAGCLGMYAAYTKGVQPAVTRPSVLVPTT